jgi:hypothetical protein
MLEYASAWEKLEYDITLLEDAAGKTLLKAGGECYRSLLKKVLVRCEEFFRS